MSWNPLDWFKPATDLTVGLGQAIDSIVTSDEERLQLRNKLVELETAFKIRIEELQAKAEEERTKRWESDNTHGTKLSRNIRPLMLIYLAVVITALAMLDGNYHDFIIKSSWVDLFSMAFGVVLGGYFVARTVDKGIQTWRKPK